MKLYKEGLPNIGGSPTLDQIAKEVRDHIDWLLAVGGLVPVVTEVRLIPFDCTDKVHAAIGAECEIPTRVVLEVDDES